MPDQHRDPAFRSEAEASAVERLLSAGQRDAESVARSFVRAQVRVGEALADLVGARDACADSVHDESVREAGAGSPSRSYAEAAMRAWGKVGAIALVAALFASPAAAQSDETLLLRSCVSERGWRTDVDDCLIVAEVVRERVEREGGTFAASLRALAPRLHDGCRVSRTWLCDLDVDCHRPAGLDATWTAPRGDEPSRFDACVETVREVRSVLAGEIVSTCVERPRHWGSRLDVARREAAGFRWRDAVCPGLVLLNRAGFLYRRLPVDPE